jgi:Cytochrome c554 and c-prime
MQGSAIQPSSNSIIPLIFLSLAALPLIGCGHPAPPPVVLPEQEVAIEGTVIDANGPVAGAIVRLQATAHSTTTSADGRFQLPTDIAAPHVTAWKEGYFVGFAPPGARPLQITLKRLPSTDDSAYQWLDPGQDGSEGQSCARCHAEIFKEWSASAHSRSAAGPHFRNLYDGTDWSGKPGVSWSVRDEHPNGLGVCASCHAPSVADDDPAQFDLHDLKGTDLQGVHCDYCHKIAGVGDGKIGLAHGKFNLRLQRSAAGQIFLGPLNDASRGDDAYSPLYHDSRYCASCHEGVVFGVHVYSTYSEWRESPAYKQGRQCQDCHMAPTGGMTNIAPGKGGVERDPRTLSNHVFFDGSQEAMLQRCLKASLECRRSVDGVRATVRLATEGAGHRVPTGFIDRHLTLVVEAEDAAGKAVAARAGPRLPAAAGDELSGKAGKLYAKLLRDFDGHSPAPFWRADPDAIDTRLEPDRTDEILIDFPAAAVRVRVRLLYSRFWDEVVRRKRWPDKDVAVWQQTVEVVEKPAWP